MPDGRSVSSPLPAAGAPAHELAVHATGLLQAAEAAGHTRQRNGYVLLTRWTASRPPPGFLLAGR